MNRSGAGALRGGHDFDTPPAATVGEAGYPTPVHIERRSMQSDTCTQAVRHQTQAMDGGMVMCDGYLRNAAAANCNNSIEAPIIMLSCREPDYELVGDPSPRDEA